VIFFYCIKAHHTTQALAQVFKMITKDNDDYRGGGKLQVTFSFWFIISSLFILFSQILIFLFFGSLKFPYLSASN